MVEFRFSTLTVIVVALIALLSAAAWMATPAYAQAPAKSRPALSPELEKVRAALEKYQDPVKAVHDGYLSTLGCVRYPRPGGEGRLPYPAGGMGMHFLNPRLVGPEPDPMKPQILLYEPVGGKLRVIGAEWLIPLATGIKERPQLFGRPFDGPMAGHDPLMPAELHHYDLHLNPERAGRSSSWATP